MSHPEGILSQCQKPSEAARRLRDELGSAAFSFVSERVEAARQRSDEAEMQRWHEIAHELLGQIDRGSGSGGRETFNLRWAYMQRIEHCRHRAMMAEREAATGSEARRRELADVAAQWRELALYAELIAQQA